MLDKPQEMSRYSEITRKEMQKSPGFSEEKYASALNRKHDELFGNRKPDFSRYSDETLKYFFDMYDTLSFYTIEKEYLSRLEEVFEVLKERDLHKARCSATSLEDTCVADMFSAYVKQGDLVNARKMRRAYPTILKKEQVPNVSEDREVLGLPNKLYEVSLLAWSNA